MTVKIGINGFGRIGRLAFRRIFELQARGGQAGDIEVAAINDLTTPSMLAYLLKYDSTHGTFRHDDGTPVDVTSTDDAIVVDGKEYKVYAEKDANNIPWVKNDGVEFVLECTGFYTSAEKSQAHLNAGAKKVLISAPAKDETTPTVVFGVNHEILKASDNIVSAGSCTTNSMAAMVKLLNDKFGIKLGFMTTIHAYTGTQMILDGPRFPKARNNRAAAINTIPHSTGAAKAIGKGLAASPGAACGKVVFSAEDAKAWAERGEKVVLVRLETSPEDIEGMKAAQGILTVRGGMTSHAAVVARGMGKCCVSGCGAIKMDEENKQFELSGKTFHEGDWLSIDGSTGKIYDGAIPTVDASIGGEFGRVMGWADQYRRLKVRTNADTPHDAAQARKFGAEGIGLCRTEHMFFDADRIPAIRRMICSDTVEQREAALAVLEPMQQSDFEGIYEAMEGLPVTIRFLDPPLHEFVPTAEADIELLAKDMGKSVAEIKAIIAGLHEFNPMMGHRGCRLAVTYPEIAAMQTRAVIKAALNVQAKHPEWTMVPEIMIPLVGEVKELAYVKKVVVETADAIIKEAGSNMKYLVGTMIEIPRAALTADEIAKQADFFSFGTNDLTQMTFGFSRDDAGKFLDAYYDKKIYENDPFAKLDQTGVGKLVDMACKMGRATNPELHLGVCGEHGGDPSSVEFFHRTGLDYVSCSPFRVPIARLAAAQAAIKDEK